MLVPQAPECRSEACFDWQHVEKAVYDVNVMAQRNLNVNGQQHVEKAADIANIGALEQLSANLKLHQNTWNDKR